MGAPALAQTTTSTTVQNTDSGTTTTTESVKKDHGGTTGGAVGGAIAGAMVAGPVGAVVGGVAGAAIGHTIAPPSQVRTYVTTQNDTPVIYSGTVAVGRTVDGEVVWQNVPDYPKYRWAHLNGQRVVIDNDTHKVVAVY
jgi:outer membrane lipoprotein SlyB